MKKGWKIFWGICIFLAVLGIALCISGVVLGATVSGIREAFGFHDRWESYFGDGSDAMEYSDASVSGGLEHAGHDETGYSESSIHEGTEYAASVDDNLVNNASVLRASGIRELDIDVTCLEALITRGEGSEILVDTSDITEKMLKDLVISQKDEELKIELKDRNSWDSWSKNQYKSQGTLVVSIPEGTRFEEVSLKVGAGVLSASAIEAQELNIEVGAGEVNVVDFMADEFELECGAGEANVSGDAVHEAKIECGVGSVTYVAAGYQQDYNYELSCGIGELNVGGDSFSGLGKERKINNGGSKKMEIECGIGSVYVTFDN